MRNHIRKIRTERQWSQGQVAQMTGVARQTINAIENGGSSDADRGDSPF
jgi:DNA-binding XRE family transcriptional regulator